jgi:DNA-binding CsgD family transcriptional regulator
VRFAWPLTGRGEELGTIDAAISAPDVSGIVVCGAAGVGKSRIAREALSHAASRGLETRWAIGTSSARTLPLGAFVSWAGTAAADNLQVVRGVIESLTSAAPGTSVVIGVDDVHLIDDLSAFVLQQIVQRRAAKLVLTVRDGEPIPPGVREIWRDGQFDRLDLQPLSREEAATLVSATLGGPLDPDAESRLWRLTRGNVLYLRNIVEQEVGDRRLTQQHGFWRWTGDPVVSSTLAELIESRIGALPSEVGDVIDTLAVGEPIELTALRRITDPVAVEGADMRGLITLDRVDGDVEVRVAHPLYGEVRRRRAASTKLRRLRGRVAAELAASEDRDGMRVVVRRAALSLDSDLEPDADLLLRAAQGAVWLADLPLADRLANAAIRAGGGAEAKFVRAHALSWLSRGEEADAVLAAIPTAELTDADHARLAFLRASNLLWSLADPNGAKRLIDNAIQTHACIDAFLTVYWAAAGKPERAFESAKDLDLQSLPNIVAAVTAWAIAVAAGDAGRISEAANAAGTGYAIANSAFDAAHMRFVIADGHIGALLLSGQISEAGDVAERLQKQSSDLPGAAQLMSAAVAARSALGAGDLRSACAQLEPTVELLFASGETNGFGYRYQLPRTTALAMRGLAEEAAAALATLKERRHPSWRYVDYEHAIAEAWVAASQGAVTEATATALAAAETARANGQFAAEVLCLQTATQFGSRATAARLGELEAIVEGPRVGIASRFATALKVGDAPALVAVSREFEQMGDVVAAIDAAAHAAVAYRQQDRRGSAFGCTTRAEELAERSGASTAALGRAAERLPLTDREREVVMLIGEGLSSRAAAQRLSLSVRTVEGHIYRAMAKTGTSTRDELVALLPRRRST